MDRALVGMRGLCLRFFSHFRSCLASRSARGIKTAECAGALVSWRRSAQRRHPPRPRSPRRPPTSAARWPPSPRHGHHLTAIPRSARPPTGTRSRHRRRSRTPAAVLSTSRRPTRPLRARERLAQTDVGPATGRLRAAGSRGQRAAFSWRETARWLRAGAQRGARMQPRSEGSALRLDGLCGRCGLLKCSADELDLFAGVAQRQAAQRDWTLAGALRARQGALGRSRSAAVRADPKRRQIRVRIRPRMLHFTAPR